MRVARSLFIVAGGLLALSATSDAATPPKNVILFIGDGLGAEQIKASGYYFNGAAGSSTSSSSPTSPG